MMRLDKHAEKNVEHKEPKRFLKTWHLCENLKCEIDNLDREIGLLVLSVEELLFAYDNKDSDCPHNFEKEATEKARRLLKKLKGDDNNAK